MPRGRGGRWSDAFREEETEIGSRAVTGRMYQGRLPGGGGLQRGVWNSAGQMEKREPRVKGPVCQAEVQREENVWQSASQPCVAGCDGRAWALRWPGPGREPWEAEHFPQPPIPGC